jgi:tRNA threonylcarbamoyladenosine biosynthesis protein TsaB
LIVIDTAGSGCAVGLVDNGAVIAHEAQAMRRGHGEALFGLLDALTGARRGAAIEGVAVCTGPGGFAAVRAGVAAARGVALGIGRPAMGVDILSAFVGEAQDATALWVATPNGAAAWRRISDGALVGPVMLCAPDALPSGAARAPDDPRARLRLIAATAVSDPPPAPLYARPPDARPGGAEPAPLLA